MGAKTKIPFSKIFFSLFFFSLLFGVAPSMAKAYSAEVKGYAWSSNIGWIKFDPKNSSCLYESGCGVSYDSVTGKLSGYAWSSNIGWIKFDGLSSYPSNGGSGWDAKANTTSGLFTGWARACAGTQSGSCGSMTSRTDGWDGWIKFDTGKNSPVKINFTQGDSARGEFTGYAWGSEVVGWISFNCSNHGLSFCANTSNYRVKANLIPSPSGSSSSSSISNSSSSVPGGSSSSPVPGGSSSSSVPGGSSSSSVPGSGSSSSSVPGSGSSSSSVPGSGSSSSSAPGSGSSSSSVPGGSSSSSIPGGSSSSSSVSNFTFANPSGEPLVATIVENLSANSNSVVLTLSGETAGNVNITADTANISGDTIQFASSADNGGAWSQWSDAPLSGINISSISQIKIKVINIPGATNKGIYPVVLSATDGVTTEELNINLQVNKVLSDWEEI